MPQETHTRMLSQYCSIQMSKSKKTVMKHHKLAITTCESENIHLPPKHNVKQRNQTQNNATI